MQFSYYGQAYHGWQNQPNAITVQQVLEQSFTTLLKRPISLVGAGRTDAGVHAKEMFAHFDSEALLHKSIFSLFSACGITLCFHTALFTSLPFSKKLSPVKEPEGLIAPPSKSQQKGIKARR